MMWRLNEVPKYSAADCQIDAQYFNKIRLALSRLPSPIRLQLRELQHIDMIIDNDSWACVDNSLNDLPIAAWTDFQTEGRDNLHEPIKCKLSYYHYQAAMVINKVLDITLELLNERLTTPAHCKITEPKKRRYTPNERELFVIS